MSRVRPRRRPHYRAIERMAILELRTARARGWSRSQTAKRFLLQPATVAEWMKRLDEGAERPLVVTPEPVNRLPDFVRHIVKRLKILCPTMGKVRIAQTLARAGLSLSGSTVGRILKEREEKPPEPVEEVISEESIAENSTVPVTAKNPNHVWQLDLTVVPTSVGFWTAWFPFASEQLWPFAWWVACVVDHHSRRVVDFVVFPKEPRSIDIRRFLGRLTAMFEHRRLWTRRSGDRSGFRRVVALLLVVYVLRDPPRYRVDRPLLRRRRPPRQQGLRQLRPSRPHRPMTRRGLLSSR